MRKVKSPASASVSLVPTMNFPKALKVYIFDDI